MKIQQILFMNGDDETLNYFAKQMGQAFLMRGLLVRYGALEKGEEERRALAKYLETPTIVFLFSFRGLKRETAVYHNKTGYIWQGEKSRAKIYHLLCDHPYHFLGRFQKLEEDRSCYGDFSYVHLSVDRNHKRFIDEYLTEKYFWMRENDFFPLAGNRFLDNKISDREEEQQELWEKDCFPEFNWKDKRSHIVFTGNYTPQKHVEAYLNSLDSKRQSFYGHIINRLQNQPKITLEQALLDACDGNQERMLEELKRSVFLDFYFRNEIRRTVISNLAKEGLPLQLIGNGWEELWEHIPDNVTILPPRDSKACVTAIAESKIALNIMPLFRDGAHDRVFTALLNGTICISDESDFLKEELQEGEGIYYFIPGREAEITGFVKELLASSDINRDASRGMKIDQGRENGYRKVSRKHSWESRTEQFFQDC